MTILEMMMRKWIRALVGLVSILASASCARAGLGAGWGEPRHDLITQEQILAGGNADLYQLVQKLRPYWIAKGGNDTPQNPGRVYVILDGARVGGLQALRDIPAAGVEYIRWYDGLEAASRWGLEHERGVIFVSTQPLRP